MAPRNVCIAVDPSETSQHALRWAVRSVINPGDKVSLFTVLHPSPESELKSGVGAVGGGARTAPVAVKPEADPKELQDSTVFLEECKQKVVAEGVKADAVGATVLVAAAGSSADVGREITHTAEACGCESLVMGSRGLGLGKKAMLSMLGVGSVSDYVLHHAPCNVVLFKDKPSA
ncbi:universal stress family [Micractinium conductrix]|uniref:Universal stress family n=1 Tax=Micractinium conductrix TaxID=554055 RepID=A0A2P6V882_9CHLO|nr:universal stress family [Micractinium conductrix]|eukprot:PSC70296.1 universal stress family [Micractinium conductrix]